MKIKKLVSILLSTALTIAALPVSASNTNDLLPVPVDPTGTTAIYYEPDLSEDRVYEEDYENNLSGDGALAIEAADAKVPSAGLVAKDGKLVLARHEGVSGNHNGFRLFINEDKSVISGKTMAVQFTVERESADQRYEMRFLAGAPNLVGGPVAISLRQQKLLTMVTGNKTNVLRSDFDYVGPVTYTLLYNAKTDLVSAYAQYEENGESNLIVLASGANKYQEQKHVAGLYMYGISTPSGVLKVSNIKFFEAIPGAMDRIWEGVTQESLTGNPNGKLVKDVQLPSFAPAVPSVTLKWSFAKAYEGAAIDGNNMLHVYPSEWENRGTVDLVATACAVNGSVLSTRSFNIGVPYLSEPFCASEEDLLYSENFDGKTDASQVNGKLTYVTQRTDGSNNISLENGKLKLVRPDFGGSYDAVRLFFNQDEKGFPGRVALEYEITREQASEVLLSADTTGSGNYVASGRWSFNTDGSDFAKAYVGQSTTNWNMNQTNLNAAFRGLGPFKVVQCFDTEERTWSLWVNGIRLLDNKLASQAGSAPVISNLYMVLQYANLNTIYVDNVKIYKPTLPAKDATELQNRDNVKLEILNMTQEALVAETIDDEAVMRFGYIPINSGCTVSFIDEKGLVNPDGTIRMPDQGTSDKVTSKVTCGSYSQSVTYIYWIAGKLEIGDYIYGDSNVVNGKNTVSIQASTRDGSDKNVVLSLAIYDADGRLKAVSYDKRSITAKSDDNILSTEVTIEKDENELYTRKTFLWAEETLSPIYKAEPTLQMPAYFTDNMVLQRRENVHIWGKAPAGAEVQVTYAAQNKTAITDANGDWSLYLDPMEAIWEGEELVIRTVDNVKRIQNVVVGEVWMVTGQSNAELTMSQYSGTANDIATANNRMIRYMKAIYTDLYATTSEKRDEYSVLMAIDWAEMITTRKHFSPRWGFL